MRCLLFIVGVMTLLFDDLPAGARGQASDLPFSADESATRRRERDDRFDASETTCLRDVTAHATLLGLRVDRRLQLFAEAGCGALGAVRVGAGYTF